MFGQLVQCPACSKPYPCASASPPSLAVAPPPAQGLPPARPAQAGPDQAIHYRCPSCSKPLESAASLAGHKINCPGCGQRLRVPQPTAGPPPVIVVPQAPLASTPPAPPVTGGELATVLPTASPAPPPRPRESCLECGVDVTERPRVQTCPDCGSLFCSARCYREHRYHAHPSRG
jgi:DNA-directed RNA polymerase subunit RPC12/RpoP